MFNDISFRPLSFRRVSPKGGDKLMNLKYNGVVFQKQSKFYSLMLYEFISVHRINQLHVFFFFIG